MERRSLTAIVRVLDGAGVRYLVVGGMAVVAHGFVRYTADIDVVLDPDPMALRRAIAALESLGYRPRAPVPFEHLADPERRASWVRDKGLTVFSLHSPDHPATEVDLFVESPFVFEEAYARAARLAVEDGLTVTFAGLDDLIALKRRAGRRQDLQDIEALNSLRDEEDADD